MPLFTQFNLPITNERISNGRVMCVVQAGSVNITITRNNASILSGQTYSPLQGFSDTFDTSVDSADWRISVTGNSLSTFTLTTP
jgi:hypothetical protein